ncbi:MAG: PAS domain S-box-containing protein, partial [Alphaproteobacteria bacterium]
MPLRIKIILLFLTGILFSASYIFLYWMPKADQAIEQHLSEMAERHLATVAELLVPPMLKNEYARIFENLNVLLDRNPNWVSLELIDDSGQRLFPLSALPAAQPTQYSFLLDIRFRNSNLGTLNLIVELEDDIKDLRGQAYKIISILFVSFLIILMVTMVIISRFVKSFQISEARYKDLVDNTNVLIQSIDIDTGKLIFANNGWLATLGYDDDEIVNLSMFDLIAADEVDHCKLSLKKAIESFEAQYVATIFRKKDGTPLNVEGHIRCRKNEQGRMVTHGVFTDVTERKKAEALSDKIGSELTQLIDTVNAPIFSTDVFGHVNQWNQNIEKITGYRKDEIMNCDFIKELVVEECKATTKTILNNALKGEETANYEVPLFTKSGERVDVL